MERIEKRNCPICDHYNNEILFTQEFVNIKEVTFLKGYEVVACKNCGFLYADNLPGQKEFDLYYKNCSKYEVKTNELTDSQISRFQASLKFIESCINNQKVKLKEFKIADIGCATGDFLRFLKGKGYQDLNGIDPSPLCVNLIKDSDINAKQGTINELEEHEKYDFIRLNAVLEHVVDLNNSITQLKKVLNKGGYLYLSVPNVQGFKELENCPFQEFSVEHINYFSKNSLSNLMRKNGFTLINYKINHNKLYSELEIIFRYDDDVIKYNGEMVDDKEAVESIKEYIERNYRLEREVNEKIKNRVQEQEPIVVWGVGTHTLRQLAKGQLGKCNIKLFVDSNLHYQNKQYNGIPIISPKQLYEYSYKILISSYYGQNSIVEYINKVLKLNNEIITLYNVEN